ADDPSVRTDSTIGTKENGNLRRLIRVPSGSTALERLQNKIAYRLSPKLWNSWNRTPDEYRTWRRAVVKTLERLSFDDTHVLVTFSHPLVDHVIGVELKRRLRMPWVAHFSDPWTDSPFLRL